MQALKGFRATDVSLMALMFFHAICAIITGSMLPRIIAEFNLDYSTAGGIETIRSYAIFFVLIITVKLRASFAQKRSSSSHAWHCAGYIVSGLSGDYTFFLFGVILPAWAQASWNLSLPRPSPIFIAMKIIRKNSST